MNNILRKMLAMLQSTHLQAPAYAEAASRRQTRPQTISNPAMAGPVSNDPNAFVSDFGPALGGIGNYLDFGISIPVWFPGMAGG
jgi:hypothetical protein